MLKHKLGILLINEWLKVYKSPIFWLLILFPISWTLFNFIFLYNLSYEDFLARIESTHKDKDPYNYVFRWYSVLITYFLPAHYVGILIYFVEQENDKWKKYLSMPIHINTFIISKLLFIVLCIVFSISISFLSLYVNIKILSMLKTDFLFIHFRSPFEILPIIGFKVCIFSLFLVPLLYALLARFQQYYIYFILSIVLPLISHNFNIFNYYYEKGLKSYFLIRNKMIDLADILGFYEITSILFFLILSIFCIFYINSIKHKLC